MTTIESSNIRSYGYAPGDKVLRVEFTNGSRYDYADVPADVVENFVSSKSKGVFFSSAIRGKFQCTRIEHEEAA